MPYKYFYLVLIFTLSVLLFGCQKQNQDHKDPNQSKNASQKSAKKAHNLVVRFKYQDKDYLIKGKKMAKGVYIFNQGAKKKITITTLEWPPYIGENICSQGWVQQLTIAILSSQGYEIKSTFYPWARTIMEIEYGKADILYPEYYIEANAPSDVFKGSKRLDHLAISRKFPGGPIAFMKRKNEKDNYQGNLKNLRAEKIGVVRGYQNTPEFDALMDQNFFSISLSFDDFNNARKLFAKRVNLIIGDPSVIRFRITHSNLDSEMRSKMLNSIELVEPVIQYNHLYYAISKKKPHWRKTLQMLNQTLEEFEASAELFHIIKNTNEHCRFVMETLPVKDK